MNAEFVIARRFSKIIPRNGIKNIKIFTEKTRIKIMNKSFIE